MTKTKKQNDFEFNTPDHREIFCWTDSWQEIKVLGQAGWHQAIKKKKKKTSWEQYQQF